MIHYITTRGIGGPWVAVEIHEMERAGISCVLHSLRPPDQNVYASDWARNIGEATRLIYPRRPIRVVKSFLGAPFVFGRRFFAALWNALTGERESIRGRAATLFHLVVACDWASEMRNEPPSLIHAQWIHSAGSIGMYGAWLLDVPFSFTGHAADLFRDRVALRDKIRRADFIVCISRFHRAFYLENGAREDKLLTAYCGIDLAEFEPRPLREGDQRARVVSVGRLVEKKGFAYLIDACALLRERGLDIECIIAGTGPLAGALRMQAAERGIADRVEVTDEEIQQEDLPELLESASVFAQPCVKAADGDMDGIPRTLMEAMAVGRPCVSTDIAGIPDLIQDDRSGLLVPPEDRVALADAIERLITDRALAERLVVGGHHRLREAFDISTCLDPLIDRFRTVLAERPPEL